MEFYYDSKYIDSPFLTSNTIEKNKLLSLLENVVGSYQNIDAVVICSIMGGYYKNDVYYSWKEPQFEKNYCLISGLFNDTLSFHIHTHHKHNTNSEFYETGLKILGSIKNIPIYSSLADTMCVFESLEIDKETAVINMGTGSQIIYSDKKYSYIPAGRALLVFDEFFNSLGLNMFEILNTIALNDVLNSSLEINLNVFKQSHKYENGGFISKINEGQFNVNNLLSSILKELVNQYKDYIVTNKILLTGGIPKKLPIIKSLFEIYYPNCIVYQDNNKIENTHRGMVKLIKKYL
jgi:hypothetical protein